MLNKISFIVFDVDGVLTNDKYLYTDESGSGRIFSVKDGYGVKLFKYFGIKIVALSGEESKTTLSRLKKIKFDHIFLGIQNKLEFLTGFLKENKTTTSDIIYVGNDLNDINIGIKALEFYCPEDSHFLVKKYAKVLNIKGGEGVIRFLAEKKIKENLGEQKLIETYKTIFNLNV